MLNKACGAVMALLLVSLFGCANNNEALAEKDRMISEQQQENLALNRRLQDAEATRKLVERQYHKKKDEAAKLTDENGAVSSERERLALELEEARKNTPSRELEAFTIDDPNVEVVTRPNGEVVLRISSEVTFAPGSATLTKKGQKTLRTVAKVLKKHRTYGLSIEGHTDDTPLRKSLGRWKTNMNLSIARALSVKEFLARSSKIGKSRMRVVGYGETHPLEAGKTKKARARNRRVEIVLYKGDN
jgi:flagellar motor protein MotB